MREVMKVPSEAEIILRLLLAALLGGAIGVERERLTWAAGLRTHVLVCVGAALVMMVSAFGFTDALGGANTVLDPSRVAAQVVSGIGFIGAGTILLRQDVIRGLTTAASIWTVAAIGLAVGGGLYLPAVATTVLVLVILAGLKPLENRLYRGRKQEGTFTLAMDPTRASVAAVMGAFTEAGAHVARVEVLPGARENHQQLRIAVETNAADGLDHLLESILEIEGVTGLVLDSAATA